jgi:DNA-binding NtrC family response regulator
MAQKLLLIDENCQLLSMVGDFLSNLGFEVHRARESDEAEALLKNYRYAFIITGEELASFGEPDHKLEKYIQSLVPKPCIVWLKETPSSACVTTLEGDPPMVVIEKPLSLLRLGDLMRELTPDGTAPCANDKREVSRREDMQWT